MSKKDIKINGKPFNCEIRRYEGGFCWDFWVDSKIRKSGRKKVISLKFDRWWLVYLAKDLDKVLEEEEMEVNRLRNLSGIKKD